MSLIYGRHGFESYDLEKLLFSDTTCATINFVFTFIINDIQLLNICVARNVNCYSVELWPITSDAITSHDDNNITVKNIFNKMYYYLFKYVLIFISYLNWVNRFCLILCFIYNKNKFYFLIYYIMRIHMYYLYYNVVINI